MNRSLMCDSPMAVYLEVTNSCNLQCSHCYMSASLQESSKVLTTGEIYSVIDDLNRMDVFTLVLSGGEPLMRKDIFDIARYASDSGMQVFLTTNGTLINNHIAATLEECGVKKVTVSIEGVADHSHDRMRGRGTLAKVKKGLDILLSHEIDVEAEITVNRQNIEELPQIAQFCKERNISGIQLNRLVTMGNASQLEEYTRADCEKIGHILSTISEDGIYVHATPSLVLCQMKAGTASDDLVEETACGGGFAFCSILWNGDVVPCSLIRDIILGNVKKESLSDIWESSPQLKAYRKAFDDPDVATAEPCHSCKYRDRCGRGCRAQAYNVSGKLTDPDPLCRLWEVNT